MNQVHVVVRVAGVVACTLGLLAVAVQGQDFRFALAAAPRTYLQDSATEDGQARDSETAGTQTYKRVLDTFVTHPDTLYMLSYGVDTDGDGAADSFDTLGTTAEHPFYVPGKNDFVPASDLKPGDPLALADGGQAVVTGIEVKRAPPGETFTTYNMEVEGFHTYFVGKHGIWVHNRGEPCERAVTVFNRLRARHPELSDREALEYLFTRLPNATHELRIKVFLEIFNNSPNKGPGEWAEVSRTFHNPINAEYQARSSGSPFQVNRVCEYRLDDVDFDDYKPGTLIERKGRYAQFVDGNGGFEEYWAGRLKLIAEAQRQAAVARNRGLTLEWHCMEPEVADAVGNLFRNEGMADIVVRHVPLE